MVAIARFLADSQLIKQGFDKSRAVVLLDARKPSISVTRECTLVLIKNPVGATFQAIEMIKLASPYSLSVLSSMPTMLMGLISWIWDADFEQITGERIFLKSMCYGVRHSEIARRLRVTGYPAEKITETSRLPKFSRPSRIKTASSLHPGYLYCYAGICNCWLVVRLLERR